MFVKLSVSYADYLVEKEVVFILFEGASSIRVKSVDIVFVSRLRYTVMVERNEYEYICLPLNHNSYRLIKKLHSIDIFLRGYKTSI